MFHMGTTAWAVAARTALVYLGLVVGLRLMGKRELGQMTVFDLVVILLIANAVQNAMTGPDFSVQGGLLAAAVLLVANFALSTLRLHGRSARPVVGDPAQGPLAVGGGREIDRLGTMHERVREDLRHSEAEVVDPSGSESGEPAFGAEADTDRGQLVDRCDPRLRRDVVA